MKQNIIKVLFFIAVLSFSESKAFSQVNVSAALSIRIAPPILLVYSQPACPVDGYLWSPGYWAYGPDGYYWVAGVWVMPPSMGLLWTPGYWNWAGGYYGWHAGYWGAHIGFYGGVNYGFGYGGVGFSGGMWQNGHFRYNTAVDNVNTTIIHNTYVNRVQTTTNVTNRYSFNGPGGSTAKPTAQEQSAMSEPHVQATSAQSLHEHTASQDRAQLYSVNHGNATSAPKNSAGRTGTSNQVQTAHNATTTSPTSVRSSAITRRSPSPKSTVPSRAPANTQTPRTVHNANTRTTHSRGTQARSTHVAQQHPVHPAGGARDPGGNRH
jgi:hypothetical protein